MTIRLPFIARIYAFAAGLIVALVAAAAPTVQDFRGVEPFLIESAAGIDVTDLSGLTWCNGRLLAISDKNNDTIFDITLRDGHATIAPAFAIPPVPPREIAYRAPASLLYTLDAARFAGRQDWEGIDCHGGAVYLVSERKNAILKVDAGKANWLPVDWYETLYAQGYLHKYNAFAEGIAVQDDDHLLVAIEREPRGILQVQRDGDRWQLRMNAIDDTHELNFRAGNADVADIALQDDKLFTLERNASAVCRRDLKTLRADSCFSYAATEKDPRWRYADSNFGIGEGFALDGQWIYIVFDSNDLNRVSAPDDRRSLLLRIPLPALWRNAR